MAPERITRADFDAVLFDLDGVLTPTATLHEAAWKQTFDSELRRRADASGSAFVPFSDDDYVQRVDGKPREDGVRDFFASRGIVLPEGEPDDPPTAETVNGIGTRKNDQVLEILSTRGIAPYPGSLRLVHHVRDLGLRTAVVSASANCLTVITAAGIADQFDARVDGVIVTRDHLRGKPAPDTYLAAATQLDVAPSRAVVFEDAISGVEAGHAGGFGLVVGVNRHDDRALLLEHGATIVVDDLGELAPG